MTGDPKNALKLVDLRRRMSHVLTEMSQTMAHVSSNLKYEKQDLARKHRKLFTVEQLAMVSHQATWPAPEMGRNIKRYGENIAVLRRLVELKHSWRIDTLLPAIS